MAHTTKRNKRQSAGLNGNKDAGNAAVTPLPSAQSSVQKNKSVSAQKSTSSSSLLSSSSFGIAEKGSVCSSGNSSKQNSGRQKRTTDDVEGAGALGVGGNKKQRRSARDVVPEHTSNSKWNN